MYEGFKSNWCSRMLRIHVSIHIREMRQTAGIQMEKFIELF